MLTSACLPKVTLKIESRYTTPGGAEQKETSRCNHLLLTCLPLYNSSGTRKWLPRTVVKAYRDRHSANRRNTRNSICYMAYARRILSVPNYFPFSAAKSPESQKFVTTIENRYTETAECRNSEGHTFFFYSGCNMRRLTIWLKRHCANLTEVKLLSQSDRRAELSTNAF